MISKSHAGSKFVVIFERSRWSTIGMLAPRILISAIFTVMGVVGAITPEQDFPLLIALVLFLIGVFVLYKAVITWFGLSGDGVTLVGKPLMETKSDYENDAEFWLTIKGEEFQISGGAWGRINENDKIAITYSKRARVFKSGRIHKIVRFR